MRVIQTIEQLRSAIREYRFGGNGTPQAVGFVPTMGYLHHGHESLLAKAREQSGMVVLSIFVNPLQFGPNEDFERYPRNIDRDLFIAERAGSDLVFLPSVEEMYPHYPLASRVVVGETAARLCGASRPGHFDGVATIVLKLFQIVQPDYAYFGLKDAQQVAVIRQIVDDFNIPVEIVPCPIVRETDGLAMSSRNVYLSKEEREQAVVLSRALDAAERLLRSEKIGADDLASELKRQIGETPLAEVDYVSVLTYPSLQTLTEGKSIIEALNETNDTQLIVAMAVKFGRTRLIDNRIFHYEEVCSHV